MEPPKKLPPGAQPLPGMGGAPAEDIKKTHVKKTHNLGPSGVQKVGEAHEEFQTRPRANTTTDTPPAKPPRRPRASSDAPPKPPRRHTQKPPQPTVLEETSSTSVQNEAPEALTIQDLRDLKSDAERQMGDKKQKNLTGSLSKAFTKTFKPEKAAEIEIKKDSNIQIYQSTIEDFDRRIKNKLIDRANKLLLTLPSDQNSKNTEGIFRLASSKSELEDLKKQTDAGEEITVSDLLLKADLIKSTIREIRPLSGLDEAVRGILTNAETDEERLQSLNDAIKTLPQENQVLVYNLFTVLGDLSSASEKTKMGPSNLGVIFGPNIFSEDVSSDPALVFGLNKLTELLIIQGKDQFDQYEANKYQ